MNFDNIERGIIGIYSITNKINGKKYIGQSIDIKRRWLNHISILNDTNHSQREKQCSIHKALQKYGVENFNFEIIEKCTEADLDDREIYWISFYNSYEQGYNETIGGNAVRIRPTYVDNIIKELQGKKSMKEIAEENNVSESTVIRINQGEHYYSQDMTYPIRKRIQRIIQYDLHGTLIAEYDSSEEASLATNISVREIRSVCTNYNDGRITAGGYQWRYEKDRDDNLNRKNKSKKLVGKYDKITGELIEVYESAAAAGRAEGVPKQHISRVCTGERKSLHGYVWKYLETDM